MCGIFGYAGKNPGGRVQRMGAVLAHRGPDGEGAFVASPFAVGMTRLAILDPEGGAQPFTSRDGEVQAVCNGEIYNWRELRSELEAEGHVFRTRCDCEVVPHAWDAWGEAMFARLNGMFAIAIHDARDHRLILARDRYGQKPLYFCRKDGEFTFASEIRALFAAGAEARFAPEHIRTYLTLRYVPEPDTLFDGIEILPAGHWMEVRGEGSVPAEPRAWLSASGPEPFGGTPDEAVEELDRLLREGVARSLQSDVPVGLYLSGGVDSALLGHAVREAGASPTAVSLGFPGPADESAAAEVSARELGLPFTRVSAGADALADLPRVIRQMELPVGDALIVAFDGLASAASSAGCKVVLGGEGADELFGGYSFHRILRTAGRLGPAGRSLAASALRFLPAGVLDRLSPFPASLGAAGRDKVAAYLRGFSAASPWWRGVALRTLFDPHESDAILHPDFARQHAHREPSFAATDDLVDAHLRDQFHGWLQDWALIRQERNGMAHSLEFRAPFLDHPLADFAMSLPAEWKLRGGGKWIWRRLAAKRLPAAIVNRPKHPFYFPLESIAADGPFREMAGDFLSEERLRRRGIFDPAAVPALVHNAFHSGEFLPLKQVAALLILEIWFDAFLPA